MNVPFLGFTDDETVMLDLDDMSFKNVKYWASYTMKRFKLQGFLILKSSENCYHVVFDRKVSWSENMSIVAAISLILKNPKLTTWFLLQCRKKEPTLRVGPKGDKPCPRIVCRYGSENGQIEGFLRYRRIIKNAMRRLEAS